MWTEMPKGKNKKPVNKDRFISKMFLRYAPTRVCARRIDRLVTRGDSVILSQCSNSTRELFSDAVSSPPPPSVDAMGSGARKGSEKGFPEWHAFRGCCPLCTCVSVRAADALLVKRVHQGVNECVNTSVYSQASVVRGCRTTAAM
jgi:hypothetical protein